MHILGTSTNWFLSSAKFKKFIYKRERFLIDKIIFISDDFESFIGQLTATRNSSSKSIKSTLEIKSKKLICISHIRTHTHARARTYHSNSNKAINSFIAREFVSCQFDKSSPSFLASLWVHKGNEKLTIEIANKFNNVIALTTILINLIKYRW